jgi:hypothetical protein
VFVFTPCRCLSHIHVLQTLHEEVGLDMSAKDASGNTVLHCVTLQPHTGDEADAEIAILEKLVEAGLDLLHKNAEGDTPLHSLLRLQTSSGEVIRRLPPLGSLRAIVTVAGPECVKVVDAHGDTCMHVLASTMGSPTDAAMSAFDILLEAGADAHAKGGDGHTALELLALRAEVEAEDADDEDTAMVDTADMRAEEDEDEADELPVRPLPKMGIVGSSLLALPTEGEVGDLDELVDHMADADGMDDEDDEEKKEDDVEGADRIIEEAS